MTPPSTILLAGPTASGKSALALVLAEALGGIIINADSMQVYRDLAIITARPSPAEEASVPHLLYGHVDASENYSVGRWLLDARAALAEAERRRVLSIFVGGTGLYFKTLTRGLAGVPPIPAELRAAVRARLRAEGAVSLYAELAGRDPATAAGLMPGDRARVSRALEVVLATGRPLSDWHREGMPAPVDPASAIKVFLSVDRSELYRRIESRFDAMLAAGALDEVEALAVRNLDPALPAMKAHGVPWLIRHLNGEISLVEAAEGGKRDTRRYTKRQATWFRHQLPDWMWLEPQEAEVLIRSAMRSSDTRIRPLEKT
ncbi:MAG TPA: tRNA (adenosine(37)-N6)-dimethylallyltransferase MiaA [Xanthobacteraceae bacterium]